VAQALHWIDRLKPKHAVLTNLHTDLDYDELRGKLPDHVEPAYDGMKLTASA
jgi:phosphoribosyl 1,2-cyclic phosphate phosphodiesterase